MAGTVITDQTEIHNCDGLSDWTNAPTLDTEVYIEGIGSLSKKISKTTIDHMKSIGVTDLSDTIIYIWILGGSIAQFDTKANGGIRIRVSDGANWGDWYVAGSDQGYVGGWQCLSVRTTQAFNLNSGTDPTKTTITLVGVVFKVTASANKINCWWDRIAYGTNLTIYAGTSGSPATFDDIITAENTNRYGIATEIEGVIYFQGKLNIGSTSAGVDTYFSDKSKIVVFRDRGFGTFYEIKGQGNGTATVQEIYFGEKAGGRGISGCIFKSAGSDKFKLTLTDSNLLKIGTYGCNFLDADVITFSAYDVNKEVLSCNFEECAQIDPDTGIFEYCNVVSADDRGLLIDTASHNVKNCNFINCPHCVHINVSVTMTFDNLKFSGSDGSSTYDIEHSVSGALTINAENGSNPNESYVDETGGGSTTIDNTVPITINVVDTNNDPLGNIRCSIYLKDTPYTELMNEDSNVATGIATESFNYATDTDVYWRVRESPVAGNRYVAQSGLGKIKSGGFEITVTMVPEPLT